MSAIKLHVYCCFDTPDEIDSEFYFKCIKTFLTIKCPQYEVELIHNVSMVINVDQSDVVKRGLTSLVKMFETLKLKTTHESWLLYISNGNISKVDNPVGLMLLNKIPVNKECFYSINKIPFNVTKDMPKEDKLENLKTFTKTLEHLVNTTKKIEFSGTT